MFSFFKHFFGQWFRLIFSWFSGILLGRSGENAKKLRIEFIAPSFSRQPFFFRSKVVFEFSLNAVDCVSGRVFRKQYIIQDNILKFLAGSFLVSDNSFPFLSASLQCCSCCIEVMWYIVTCLLPA